MITPSDMVIDKAMRLIARAFAARRLRTIASGLENIPTEGPALIAARHYHHLFDGLALFAAIERRFHIVVTLDWVQNRPTKLLFLSINRLARWPTLLRGDALARRSDGRRPLFIDKDLLRYQRKALRQAVELLSEGRLLVLFPEGYPNIDPVYTPKSGLDDYLPFKPGFLKIVRLAETKSHRSVPIIPAGLHYQRGAPWIAHINFGPPLYRGQFPSERSLIEECERRVVELSSSPPTARV